MIISNKTTRKERASMSDEKSTSITIHAEPEMLVHADFAAAGMAADRVAAANIFVDYQQRQALRTRKAQREDLVRFARFLADASVHRSADDLVSDPNAWRGVTWGLVKGFVIWQTQQGFAIASINRSLSSVKRFAALAHQVSVLDTDTYQRIKNVAGYSHKEARRIDSERPQRRQGEKKATATIITDDQATTLKTPVDSAPIALRDAFMMCLLIDHGLRVSELAALTYDAINLRRGTMRFYREKVDKVQTHKLTADTLQAAARYLPERGPKPGALLILAARRGGALLDGSLSTRAINERVGLLGQQIGIVGLSPHDLRHYWVTKALQNGSDVASVLQAGAWASLASLQRYINEHQIANDGIKLS